MRHPHADLIKEWAEDTSRVVQFINPAILGHDWEDVKKPAWCFEFMYRFKPEPKPDVVQEWWFSSHSCSRPHPNDSIKKSNLKLTFDGETGKLIKAEVIE